MAVVFVLAPHEWGHAFVAYKCGDGTAKMMGRMTLNPMKHLDPMGFLCCALVGFGWAKPVPVNAYNFRNYRRGLFLTAIAGVTVNYIIAFVDYLVLVLFIRYVGPHYYFAEGALYYLGSFVETSLYLIYAYSLSVFVFNLLPLNPLDGFRVVQACTRQINPVRRFLENYGQMILIVLIAESFICNFASQYVGWIDKFNVLGYVLDFAATYVGYPIQAAWNWILKI